MSGVVRGRRGQVIVPGEFQPSHVARMHKRIDELVADAEAMSEVTVLEPEKKCEIFIAVGKQHGAEAQWLAVCRNCGSSAFTCSPHRSKLIADVRRYRCRCGHDGTIPELIAFVPIAGQ
jgi:hypothetical protein